MPHSKLKMVEEKPWYREGLRFSCTECGKCCTGSPGYVWVEEEEIVQLANHLKMSVEEFARKYLRKVGRGFSLQEHPKTFDCVFLKNHRCTVYSSRPKQCKSFPWWQSQLHTKEDWEEAAKHCEGIHRDAPIITYEKIQEQLDPNS